MRSFGAVLKWVILLPILAVALLLAVANGDVVTVHLNPIDSADPVLRVELPLYQLGFILFAIGALVGGLVAWGGERRRRRRARWREDEAAAARRESAAEAGPRPAAAGFLPRPGRG